MTRTLFAMAIAGAIFAAVPAATQAAPMAPLPAGATGDHGVLTQVQWGPHWRRGWGWRGGRRCWRGRWGRLHCRW